MSLRIQCNLKINERLTDDEMDQIESALSECISAALAEMRSSRNSVIHPYIGEIHRDSTTLVSGAETDFDVTAHG